MEPRTNSFTQGALGLIGHTALVALDRVHTGPGRVFGKAEFLQPGGSVKDRAARAIIQGARTDGCLKPGQTVVTMTSGNFGAGLAVVCALLGHPFVATMSTGNSPERAKMMRAFGAEVVQVPQVDGSQGRVTGADISAADVVARQIAKERDAFYVDQFNDKYSVIAHQEGTGPEIWEQLAGKIDGFVACVGSGGTFVGTARFLKDQAKGIVCAAVEPEGAEALAGKAVTKPDHLLQGTSYGRVPPCWDPALMDLSISVSDDEAQEWRDRLAKLEGLYVGFSAAANVLAAVKLLQSGRVRPDGSVATILCDTGLKY